jgi:hypothetical protein
MKYSAAGKEGRFLSSLGAFPLAGGDGSKAILWSPLHWDTDWAVLVQGKETQDQ